MALINPPVLLTPVQQNALFVRTRAARLHMFMVQTHQEIFSALWNHDSVDAQDTLDEIGADATSLFANGSDIIDLILAQNPASLTAAQYVPPRAPMFNVDGTVTLAT